MTYEILESKHEVSVYDGAVLVAMFFTADAKELASRFVTREEHLDAVADMLWDS